MIISLTGFMGCGKTCTGRLLSERLGWEFIDLDEYIEHKWGQSIPELFGNGETMFRALEAEAVRDVITMHRITLTNLVLSLGGGTLEINPVIPLILDNTVCIYLEAGVEFLHGWLQGTEKDRPLLDCDKIGEMLESRKHGYGKARYRVNAEQPTEDIVNDIKKILSL